MQQRIGLNLYLYDGCAAMDPGLALFYISEMIWERKQNHNSEFADDVEIFKRVKC